MPFLRGATGDGSVDRTDGNPEQARAIDGAAKASARASMDLRNKIALITGGKRIGAVIATTLAGRGVDVALGYGRSRAEAEQTAEKVRATGRRAALFQADLRHAEACEGLVNAAANELGGVDILINMASVYVREAPSTRLGLLSGTPLSTWTCARPSYARRPPFRTCAGVVEAASSISAIGLRGAAARDIQVSCPTTSPKPV